MSFKYDIKNKHKLVHSLRYWFSDTIKYGFAYQRFVALYDASVFNSPVVISKVTTGLPYISGEFVYPRQSFDMETLNGFNIHKDGKNTQYSLKHAPFFIKKDEKPFLVFNNELVSPEDANHLNVYKIIDAYYAKSFGTYKIYTASTDNIFNEYDKMLSSHVSPSVNIYRDDILGQYSIPAGNINDTTAAQKLELITNESGKFSNAQNIKNASAYQNYHGQEHSYIMSSFPNAFELTETNETNTGNDIIFIGKRDNEMNTVDSLTFVGQRDNEMSISDAVLSYQNKNKLNVNSINLARPDDNVMTYLPLHLAKRISDDKLVKGDIIKVSPKQRALKENQLFSLTKEQFETEIAGGDIGLNITIPSLSYYNKDKILYRERYYSDLNDTCSTHKVLGNLEIDELSGIFRQNPRIDYDYYSLHGRVTERFTDFEHYMRLGEPGVKQLVIHKDVGMNTHFRITNINPTVKIRKDSLFINDTSNFYALNVEHKHLGTAQELWANKYNEWTVYYDNITASRDKTRVNYEKDAMFVSQNSILLNINNLIFGSRDRTAVDVPYTDLFLSMDRKSTDIAKKDILANRDLTNIQLYMPVIASQERINVLTYPGQQFMHRNRASTVLYEPSIIYKESKVMESIDSIAVYKQSVNTSISSDIYVKRHDNILVKQNNFDVVYKTVFNVDTNKQIDITTNIPEIDINKHLRVDMNDSEVLLNQQNIHAYKASDKSQVNTLPAKLFKYESKVFNESIDALYLIKPEASYYNDSMSLFKDSITVSNTSAVDSAIKAIWHVRLNNFGSSHNGLIIPVSKSYSDVSTFNNEIGKMAYKSGREVFFTENAMASILSKPTFIPSINLLGADRLYQDVMIDVYNYYVEKKTIKAMVYEGDFLYYSLRDTNIATPVSQMFKETSLGTNFDNGLWGFKEETRIIIYDQIMSDMHKMAYNTQIYKQEFGDRGRYGIYYFYETISEKTKSEMTIYGNLQTTTKDAQMNLYNLFPAYNKSRSNVSMFEPVVYGGVPARDIDVIQQLKAAETSRKEVEVFLSDFGNWAWVYETPSPFESKLYGIDELLLPEEDTRYEQFEDIIFDKETLTPRNPVKVLSPTSFIAKYPIDIPVDEYADVGSMYDDSAEKWEQYFGIETDVMRDIYLKYYQIWQSKIFEFSTMTMVQSTKKMLEYLYTWIDMYYPVEKMKQALRVFRQIRWYSESAIIRNSQYIISYEYDTLKSNLHTGTCHVPNDLDSITNPTMYVDTKNAVIRNDKTFLGQDAHVTFEIDVQKNTYIKFDLFTEYGKGTALIYLNDVLVRACTSATLGVIIEIPYTGDVNHVTIIKKGDNNIGEFYVGNISIPNATFKNLSIEFDPVLRAGNKPLEEVAKKMIACANLYADKNEMYAVIKRSSLGFSETYKQMNDYWMLHHQDKIKGKRLTIKQT